MTQVAGRPPGIIKFNEIHCLTFLHTRNYQDTGRPPGSHSHTNVRYFVRAHTSRMTYHSFQHCVSACVSPTLPYSRTSRLINSYSFPHTRPMLPQSCFIQPCVSTIRPYSSGLVLVLLVSEHSPRLISFSCVSILSSYSSSQRILPYWNKYKTSPFQDCCLSQDCPKFPIILTVQATVPPVSNQQATIYSSKRWSSEPCVLPSFSYTSLLNY